MEPAAERGLGRTKNAGGNVKILLPETEVQGLAGSREQRGSAAGGACAPNPLAAADSRKEVGNR